MTQIYNDFYKKYYSLRNEVDELSEKLFKLHESNVACKKGCDLCCMDYKVFPIEFFAIKKELEKEGLEIKDETKNPEDCIFLKDHACSIYKYRPFICRTHGLPLVFVNEEDEWELSNCELNFKDFDFEKFTLDNTFEQDKMNSQLFQLNKKFIESYKEEKFVATDLISVRQLQQDLE